MRNRNQIIVLEQQINEATSLWAFPPLGTPGLHMGKCTRCGGEKHAPAGLVRDGYTPYCADCFPGLADQIQDLKARLDQQKPRDVKAKEYRRWRGYISAAREDLPYRFQKCEFKSYIPQNESQVFALDQLRKWTLNTNNERERYPFFVIHGTPGLGKTHLMIAAWNALARQMILPAFNNESAFVREWIASHSEYQNATYYGRKPEKLIGDTVSSVLLMWDDLGKAKMTDAWSNTLYNLIDHRYVNRLPTLITTNFTPDELPKRIPEWIADRVLSGISIPIEGQSQRGIIL